MLIKEIAETSSRNTEISNKSQVFLKLKNYHELNCQDVKSVIQKYLKVSKMSLKVIYTKCQIKLEIDELFVKYMLDIWNIWNMEYVK